MKKLLFLCFLCFCSLANGQENEDINGNLIGYINKSDFLKGKHKNWFLKNYEDYLPNQKIVQKIKKRIKDVSVKAFIGSWCHDSKRELPRFYKIMESAVFDLNINFQMVGISIGKKTPDNLQEGYQIKHTPTFIFYKKGEEIGRYVEHAKKTLEKDILKILRTHNYKHPYQK